MANLWRFISLSFILQGVMGDFEKFHHLSVQLDHSPCVRLFYNHGEIGCKTKDRGGVTLPLGGGVVDSAESLEYWVKTASAYSHRRLAAAVSSRFFNTSVVAQLQATDAVGAILVLEEGVSRFVAKKGSAFSTDVKTPQGEGTPMAGSSVGPTYPWNPWGNGLQWMNVGYPIILVHDPKALSGSTASQDSESVLALRKAAAHNKANGLGSHPLYMVKLDFYFGPEKVKDYGDDSDFYHEVTSLDCLAWQDIDGERDPQCLPLGGLSTWASLPGPPDPVKPKVFLTAAIDSATLFHDQVPAASDVAATLAAILGAADLLGRSPYVADLPSQIVVALFQGEQWGYIGSRRFIHDLLSFECENLVDASESSKDGGGGSLCLNPMYPSLAFQQLGSSSAVQHVLAVDQVALVSDDGQANLFVHPTMGGGDLADKLIIAADSVDAVTVAKAFQPEDPDDPDTADPALPPSPLTSFVSHMPKQVSGAVLAGYDRHFLNARYHTQYDIIEMVDLEYVRGISEFLAYAMFAAAGGDVSGGLGAELDNELVADLLECLTQNLTCSTVDSYLSQEEANLSERAGVDITLIDHPDPNEVASGAEVGERKNMRQGGQPNYYSGVFGIGPNGQPVMARRGGESPGLYARFDDKWNAETDYMYAVSSPLEGFLRAFLADKFTQESKTQRGDTPTECKTSSDCGPCEDSNSDDIGNMECVYGGQCACRVSFHHVALDPGIQATEVPNKFDVIDQSSPIFTEPNWRYLGAKLYPYSGKSIELISLLLGICITVLSAGGSYILQQMLIKKKLL